MGKEVKRTRITVPKTAAVKISIRPITREKNGSVWVTYLVFGRQNAAKVCVKIRIAGSARRMYVQ